MYRPCQRALRFLGIPAASLAGVLTAFIMDPICTDESTLRLRVLTTEVVRQIDPALTIHDFRAVPGPTHTNLIFDVVAPHSFRMEDTALREIIRNQLLGIDPAYQAVIQVDHSYTE